MGNCIDLQKPILWVEEEEEEWEAAEPPSPAHCREEEKTERVAAASATPPAEEEGSTEIKIKISKKQLEELLHQADEKGLPLNKVLADIVAIGGVCTNLQNTDRRWRPNLQSIPEVSE